jgi:phenylacetate-CoA ligase
MTTTMAPADATAIERLRALAGELLARDAWPRERLVAHQRERLRATLTHAVAASPYYREALGPHATDEDVDLATLPVLTKETLLARFDEIVTDPRIRLADVEAHLAGPDAGELLRGKYRVSRPRARPGCAGSWCSTATTWRWAPR